MNLERNNGETRETFLRGVIMLNAKAVGLSLGVLLGLAVFVATNWLVIKGGEQVGPHLAYLGQYFIGYRVTFVGSLIGFAYAFVLGFLSGMLISLVYNLVATKRQGHGER